jgi:hypothetical protein
MRDPAQATNDGVRLFVRVTPKSANDSVDGLRARGDETRLAVKVRAQPHDGDANAAVLALLAKSFGCKPSALAIAAGHKDRDKTVLITGARLDQVRVWLDGLADGEID